MPLLVSDARSRMALQIGLAIIAAEEAVMTNEAIEQKFGDALERAYKAIAGSDIVEQFIKDDPELARCHASRTSHHKKSGT